MPENKDCIIINFGGVDESVQQFLTSNKKDLYSPELLLWMLGEKKYTVNRMFLSASYQTSNNSLKMCNDTTVKIQNKLMPSFLPPEKFESKHLFDESTQTEDEAEGKSENLYTNKSLLHVLLKSFSYWS